MKIILEIGRHTPCSAYACTMIDIPLTVDSDRTAHESPPNPYWWERLFKTIDAGDAAGFVAFLTPDAQFRFGNAPMIQGAPEIGAAVTGFFGTIRSSRHRLVKNWCSKESPVVRAKSPIRDTTDPSSLFPSPIYFNCAARRCAPTASTLTSRRCLSRRASGFMERGCVGVVSRPNS